MKTYPIPDALLAAAVQLIERLPASRDVRGVLNAIENVIRQADAAPAPAPAPAPVAQGGGGPGEPEVKA